MPLIETSLHESYQKDTWRLIDAAREIISNAFDGERRYAASGRGRMSIDYTPRTKVMRVTNEGVTVPTRALLMGESEARDEKAAIGQFGEGLPMALLVLARRGMEVTILNGDEKWEPCIEESPTYKSRVLMIRTRQLLKARDAFVVEMHGIEKEEYHEVLSLFLALDEHFAKNEALSAGDDGEQILLNPHFRGRVYNKGVYVCTNDELMYGYDLCTTLNRDRSFVKAYDLDRATQKALEYAAQKSEAFRQSLVQSLLYEVNSFEGRSYSTNLYYMEEVTALVASEFVRRFGELAIPVANLEQAREAEFFGRTGVILNDLARQLVTKGGVDALHEVLRSGRLEVVQLWQLNDLSDEARTNYTQAMAVLRLALPSWEPNVRVVSFKGDTVLGTYRDDSKQIDIAAHVLTDFRLALTTLVHEVAHCLGKDGTLAHGEGQVQVFARIVDVLLRGPAVA